MSSLIKNFVNRVDFDSYDDFKKNFEFKVPKNFNFAYDVVDRYAKEDPEKIALVWCNDEGEEEKFTFQDMKKYSDKAANLIKSYNIKKGDKVMLTLKNRYEFWFTIIALHKIGAIPIPATHMLKKKDIVYRIEKATITMIISVDDPELLAEFEKAESELGVNLKKLVVSSHGNSFNGWDDFKSSLETSNEKFARPTGDEDTENDDIMIIYFSSGTSGQPKMVAHDFRYPIAHIITSKYWHNALEDGLHHTSADTGWMKAVWGGLYGQWIVGTGVFIYDYDRFNPVNLVEKIAKYKINTFCAPPTIYRFLIKEDLSKYDFSNLTYCTTAGEPLNPEVYNKVQEIFGLKLKEAFGQTETVVSIANFVWMDPKPGSMGKPAPKFNVELLDDNYNNVDIGDEAEISLKIDSIPPGLFMGYYRDEEKTKEVWHDGYYRTGDTAWKDEDGFLWFVGRIDDIIKSSGYRIGPFEVESALISHPSVLECAITGTPDPIRGQIVKATIVLVNDYEPSDELKKQLQNHVKKETAPYKYPRVIEFVDELPKTISGKIRRVAIRNEDKNQTSDN
ncbi:MAG: AMP-binding protein [Methanobacteriaceae archaeon]|jgi:acetyl-CoA synthetase|nr:AMP-binding protein [Candidatus Methanorudis spinitermitis]